MPRETEGVRWVFVAMALPNFAIEFGIRHADVFNADDPLDGPVRRLDTLHAVESFRSWWSKRFVTLNLHPSGDEISFPISDETAVQLLREWP